MVQESRCVKGSILLNHRLEKKNMLKEMISIFFIACKGETPSDISTDSSGSGVPTVSKDIAGQLQAAKYLYSSVLGLRFPLQQKISMLRPGKSMSMRCNCRKEMVWPSIAWRQKRYDDWRAVASEGLKFVLNAAAGNRRVTFTPAPRIFHLYRYGYAVFKQKWYLEGMARWMENSFKAPGENTRRLSPLPHCDSNFTRVITPRITGRASALIFC